MSRTYRIPFIMVLFMSVTNPGFATNPPTIELEKAVHFLAPDGSDVVVPEGAYTVTAAESWLQLIPEGGQKQEAFLIEAEVTTHEERGDLPQAITSSGEKKDLQHVVLLLPDGRLLEALGTFSGIRPRGLQLARLSTVKRKQVLQAKQAMVRNGLSHAGKIKSPIVIFRPMTLEVQQLSKDFEKWGQDITINSRTSVTFRWSAGSTKASAARWEVSDRNPTPKRGRVGRVTILGQGPLSLNAPSVRPFQINFSFLPRYPPARPNVYKYWVTVKLLDEDGQMTGESASAVRVEYRAPSETTEFTFCTTDLNCADGAYCRKSDGSCQPHAYRCGDIKEHRYHLIEGTDGTTVDCTPYICVPVGQGTPFCKGYCFSSADCAAEFQCDAYEHCVPRPR